MSNIGTPKKEAIDLDGFTITEQLRLFSLTILAINTEIVTGLVERNRGFSSLALKAADGQFKPIIDEVDSENRVMLNNLYYQFGVDGDSAIVRESGSEFDSRLRRIITAPNGITFIESYNAVGDW